ncbi:hypothetical protein [Streptomyces sp. NPDC127190]|uniref:hypothetical protein n=1 Tax=unclassified Streptomyces TaxID=2593676 RepID=UPI0036390E2A
MWLKEQILGILSTASPAHLPVLVRAWTDPVHLNDPEPVGHRSLLLAALDGAGSPGVDAVQDAFRSAGWETAGRETVRHGDNTAEIRQGRGPAVLMCTAWSPVVFPARALGQPSYTLSTVDGVLCDTCHGWGACMDCEGTGRDPGNPRSYGRCWCYASNYGPGSCVECEGRGAVTASSLERKRRPYPRLTDGYVPDPEPETGHDTNLGAFVDVVHRACVCGEFRCRWDNTVTRTDSGLHSLFTGLCPACGERRGYAFALPAG